MAFPSRKYTLDCKVTNEAEKKINEVLGRLDNLPTCCICGLVLDPVTTYYVRVNAHAPGIVLDYNEAEYACRDCYKRWLPDKRVNSLYLNDDNKIIIEMSHQ